MKCPMHERLDGYTCPVKPCKYAGKSDAEVSRLAAEAWELATRQERGLLALYGDDYEAENEAEAHRAMAEIMEPAPQDGRVQRA